MKNTEKLEGQRKSHTTAGLAGGDLHGRIMNLPCDPSFYVGHDQVAFKSGHRNARHAAAELAIAADARIKELETALKEAVDSLWNYAACAAARKA